MTPDAAHPFGRVLSTGGYHNAAAPAALGMLSLAWAELTLLAERQVTAMHLSSVSGLPHFLNPRGFEPDSAGGATNLFGWVAGSFAEEARTAAAPTLLPASINDPQNDVSSATFSAYRKERRAAECLEETLAHPRHRLESGPLCHRSAPSPPAPAPAGRRPVAVRARRRASHPGPGRGGGPTRGAHRPGGTHRRARDRPLRGRRCDRRHPRRGALRASTLPANVRELVASMDGPAGDRVASCGKGAPA